MQPADRRQSRPRLYVGGGSVKAYRRRFILFAMLAFVSTMLIVGGIINIANYVTTQRSYSLMLSSTATAST